MVQVPPPVCVQGGVCIAPCASFACSIQHRGGIPWQQGRGMAPCLNSREGAVAGVACAAPGGVLRIDSHGQNKLAACLPSSSACLLPASLPPSFFSSPFSRGESCCAGMSEVGRRVMVVRCCRTVCATTAVQTNCSAECCARWRYIEVFLNSCSVRGGVHGPRTAGVLCQ